MTIDERISALTMNLELAHRNIHELQAAAQKDGENIRQLGLIAQSTLESIRSLENVARPHEQRLDDLE